MQYGAKRHSYGPRYWREARHHEVIIICIWHYSECETLPGRQGASSRPEREIAIPANSQDVDPLSKIFDKSEIWIQTKLL